MTTTKTDADRINEYLATRPDATMRDLHNKLDISIVKIRTLRDASQINLKPSKHNWMATSPILRRAA